MFHREQRQPKDASGAGGLCATAYLRVGAEVAYQRRAEVAMASENSYKIYIVSVFYLIFRLILETIGIFYSSKIEIYRHRRKKIAECQLQTSVEFFQKIIDVISHLCNEMRMNSQL